MPHIRNSGKFRMDDVLDLGDALIADVDNNPPTPEMQSYSGFVSAFWDYPKAEGYACVPFLSFQSKY